MDNRLSDKQSDTGRDAVVTELAECFGRKPEIFSDMQEVWIAASDEADEQHFDKERAYQLFLEHTENLVQPSVKRKTLTISPWMYAAAMVVIVFFCGTIAFQSGKRVLRNQLTQITVEAPYGSKTKLYLPDGTLVWLNAGSKMSYAQDFGINERSLNLSGEAYFEVTRNEEIPFKVHTEELDVKVLGTKFNFRNYKDDLEAKVCLLEGKVALNTRQKETILHPDQQALLDKKQENYLYPIPKPLTVLNGQTTAFTLMKFCFQISLKNWKEAMT